MQKIVIVMPVWNEADNLKKMVKQLVEVEFPKIDADMNLLVVDNHSKDDTVKVVESYSKNSGKVGLIQQKNNGLGWAYVSGFQYAMKEMKADAILEMDGDFQHPPRFVKPMVDAFLNDADYVIGSRYVKGGSIPKEWEFSRKAVSFLGNLFIRLVLIKPSIHDLTTGFRLSRVKGVLDKIDLSNLMELDRFAYKVDLMYQSLKLSKKTVEVPLEFASRTMEKSKFRLKEMTATFKVAVILGIKDKIRFIKFGTVGFTGYLVNALTLDMFTKAGLSATFSALFSTELAIISNFILNNLWTFSEVKITKPLQVLFSFLKFNLSSGGALIIQATVIGGSVYFFGDTRTVRQVALLVGMPLVLTFNYIMYNVFIWKTWGSSSKKKQ